MYLTDASGTVMLIPVHNMKKIFNEYKVYFGIGLLVIIFGLLLFWPQGSKEKKLETGNENMTKIVGLRQKTEGVDWGDLKIEEPEKLPILKSKSSFINGDRLNILMKVVGMEGVEAIRSDSFYVIYENKDATLTIKLRERQIDYLIKRKLSYVGEKEKTKAINNFNVLMSQISERKISDTEVEYFKDEFRATRSTIYNADFMELSANFLFNNTPVMNYQGGPSIKAQYGFDGQLGRLTIFNPFDDLANDKEVELIRVNDIKSLPPSSFPIFKIKGNREFAMSTGEEVINMIKGGTGQVAYLFEPLTNSYVPYLVVDGNTRLKSGDTEVTFGVPLVKQ